MMWPSRLERQIALRYMRSHRSSRLVSLITLIAVGGVTVGVMALVVVLGVMNGLQTDLRDKILVGNPHLRILTYGEGLRLDEALHEIPRRFPDIDLGLFHLGGTRLFGLLLTMDARQGVEAVRIVNPGTAVPIHYDDYPVFKSPLDDFKRAVQEAGLESRVRYIERGESLAFEVPESRRPRPLTAGAGRR